MRSLCIAMITLFLTAPALAGLVTDFPALIWLSPHKGAVFGISALMIIFAGSMLLQARRRPCPADPVKARACIRLRIFSWWIWGFSVLCFTIGAFFAFIAPALNAPVFWIFW